MAMFQDMCLEKKQLTACEKSAFLLTWYQDVIVLADNFVLLTAISGTKKSYFIFRKILEIFENENSRQI